MTFLKFIPVLGIVLSMNLACTKKVVDEAEDADEEEVPEVAVIQLQKEELFDFMSYSTTLAARSQVSVYSPLSGSIRELSIQEGVKVSKGQTLLVIKPDSEGFEINDHIVKAPREGTILGGITAKAGIHIDKNQELLSVADLGAFKAEISATVDDLPFLEKDQKVDVHLSVFQKVQGVISFIPRTPDAKTKTFAVIVSIPCPTREACADVYAGLLANVVIKKNPHMGYRLAFKYLRRQQSHILVVNEDNTVRFTEVEVGQHYGQDVEILKGVTPQTRIVTSFSTMPQEGQKVKIAASDEPNTASR